MAKSLKKEGEKEVEYAASFSLQRRHGLYALAAAGAAAGGAAAALWRYQLAQPEGEALGALWAMQASLPNGQSYAIAPLRGKVLLLNFWATWCPPCIEELPLLDAFYRQNVVNGWQVLGLALDQAAAVKAFLARTPLQFPTPVVGLAGMDLARKLGNLSGGLPFTVLIDAQERVIFRQMGKLTAAQIADFPKLLAGKF